jgi:3-phenylpropionate/trans-cinnamate dioxygenase ferredoxin reductase subunit
MAAVLDREPGIVIVGAGEAGLRAALTLRGKGFAGPLTVVGGETHPPYERPPLSKSILHAEPSAPASISGAADIEAKSIRLTSGLVVVAINRLAQTVTLSDGADLPYSQLLIAIGARARPLGVEGAHLARTLRRLDDAVELRKEFDRAKRVLVIGGGFIGLELAVAARVRGLEVIVAEAASRILARATPESIGAVVAAWHRDAGVDLRTCKALRRLSVGSGGVTSEFSDGDSIVADLVVAGVGAEPETSLADAAGLAVENGIAVDGRLRTSDPLIFAAGDCASFPHPLFGGRRLRLEAWRNAQDQGAFVAGSLLEEDGSYDSVPWFWSDQYDQTLQVAGLPTLGARVVERRPGGGALLTFHLDDRGRLVGAAGAGPIGMVARDVRIAEKMIAQSFAPHPDRLADLKTPLKAILIQGGHTPPRIDHDASIEGKADQ